MSLEQFLWEVPPEEAGERLDKWLCAKMPQLTRSGLQKLCDEGFVRCGQTALAKSYKVKSLDSISVLLPEAKPLDTKAEDIPLDVVYEDADLLVVNKPKGMVVHPAAGNYEGTLVNALLHHCRGQLSGINGVERPGILHRIDKNTSGLLLVAKTDFAHLCLAEQVKAHSMTRMYEAVVYGVMKESDGTVDAPIGRDPVHRKKMTVTKLHSRNAVTHYHTVAQYGGFAHIQCRLETGRTHQIRVHMAYIGHPLAGDDVYGPKKVIRHLNGQCLHARTLGFVHPRTGERMEFTSPLPEYFIRFLNTLRA
ncbi:MAG: RluA family pseudouridine synthase [Oscillospiraceae bacterium]|nr:RluA family pseudouridine synthase [Oscillospiraceae bacterium]